jgi:hypothetical protein
MAEKMVDQYIAGLEGWKAEIVSSVRRVVREAAPDAKESLKWSQPVYEINGPFCYVRAFKDYVNLGFWRGADLQDPKGLLQGSGDKMRHVQLRSMDDVDEGQFADFVRQAVELNRTKGDPTKGP